MGYNSPMSKLHKKPEAIRMRKEGFNFLEIAKKLDVSKSTVANWCNEIGMSKQLMIRLEERSHDARMRGRMAGATANREARNQRVNEAREWAKRVIGSRLSERDSLCLGIGLYWGEGTKGRKLNFSNSNPAILMFIMKWFELFGVAPTDFQVRIFINESHRDRYSKVKKFWTETLRVPPQQFYDPTYTKTPHKKVYENRESYYGVVALRIRKSANLQNKILGLMEAVVNAEVAQVVRASHS